MRVSEKRLALAALETLSKLPRDVQAQINPYRFLEKIFGKRLAKKYFNQPIHP
jgi:hypothetical protein